MECKDRGVTWEDPRGRRSPKPTASSRDEVWGFPTGGLALACSMWRKHHPGTRQVFCPCVMLLLVWWMNEHDGERKDSRLQTRQLAKGSSE